jgi:phosphoinositide-3-kinase regulatory subunit 4
MLFTGAISFILACAKRFSQPDLWCILYPIVRPLLKNDVIALTEEHLVPMLKAPVSNNSYLYD